VKLVTTTPENSYELQVENGGKLKAMVTFEGGRHGSTEAGTSPEAAITAVE
jgi:hypothetical protein